MRKVIVISFILNFLRIFNPVFSQTLLSSAYFNYKDTTTLHTHKSARIIEVKDQSQISYKLIFTNKSDTSIVNDTVIKFNNIFLLSEINDYIVSKGGGIRGSFTSDDYLDMKSVLAKGLSNSSVVKSLKNDTAYTDFDLASSNVIALEQPTTKVICIRLFNCVPGQTYYLNKKDSNGKKEFIIEDNYSTVYKKWAKRESAIRYRLANNHFFGQRYNSSIRNDLKDSSKREETRNYISKIKDSLSRESTYSIFFLVDSLEKEEGIVTDEIFISRGSESVGKIKFNRHPSHPYCSNFFIASGIKSIAGKAPDSELFDITMKFNLTKRLFSVISFDLNFGRNSSSPDSSNSSRFFNSFNEASISLVQGFTNLQFFNRNLLLLSPERRGFMGGTFKIVSGIPYFGLTVGAIETGGNFYSSTFSISFLKSLYYKKDDISRVSQIDSASIYFAYNIYLEATLYTLSEKITLLNNLRIKFGLLLPQLSIKESEGQYNKIETLIKDDKLTYLDLVQPRLVLQIPIGKVFAFK